MRVTEPDIGIYVLSETVGSHPQDPLVTKLWGLLIFVQSEWCLSLLAKTLPQRQVWNIWGKGNLKYLCSEQVASLSCLLRNLLQFQPWDSIHGSLPKRCRPYVDSIFRLQLQRLPAIYLGCDATWYCCNSLLPKPNGPPVGHNSSLELCFSSAKTWSCHWMMSADPRSKFLPMLQVVKSPGLNDEANLKEARFEKRKRHSRISCDRASQCSSMSNQFHHIIYFIICMKYSYFTPQSLVCSGGEKIADHTMTDLPVIWRPWASRDPEPRAQTLPGCFLARFLRWVMGWSPRLWETPLCWAAVAFLAFFRSPSLPNSGFFASDFCWKHLSGWTSDF